MMGAVELDIAKGRRELGWEIGFVAVGGTAPVNPVAAIVLNNDADFVVTRMWVMQWGLAAGNIPLPSTILMNIRDGATSSVLFRQPGVPSSFCSVPYWAGAAPYNQNGSGAGAGRFSNNAKGLPAPYLIRRGSTVFFEFTNSAAYTFGGDLYVGLEGFRVYPQDADPIPKTIKGYALPYSWNGTLVVPSGLSAGIQFLGTITAPGPGPGKYVLKQAAISSTLYVAPQGAVNSVAPPDNVLAIQIRDTLAQGKFWARMSTPPALGQYMPAAMFTGGGTSAPWPQPRYMTGQDTINMDLFGDPAAFNNFAAAANTIEVQLNGVYLPG